MRFSSAFKNWFLYILLAVSLLCGGCSSRYGQQQARVGYYPECYAPIQQLRASEPQYGRSMVAGAFLGALAGAAIGALATGDARGAAVGAGVGAVAGTVGGHMYASGQAQNQAAQRLAAYSQEIAQDMARVDSAILAAHSANRCYDNRYDEALALYDEDKISRQSFEARVKEIRDGVAEAEFILGNLSDNVESKHQKYVTTVKEEAAQMGRPVPETSAPADFSAQAGAPPASPDPLVALASQAGDLDAKRRELDMQREDMRLRLQQYEMAQQAVAGV